MNEVWCGAQLGSRQPCAQSPPRLSWRKWSTNCEPGFAACIDLANALTQNPAATLQKLLERHPNGEVAAMATDGQSLCDKS